MLPPKPTMSGRSPLAILTGRISFSNTPPVTHSMSSLVLVYFSMYCSATLSFCWTWAPSQLVRMRISSGAPAAAPASCFPLANAAAAAASATTAMTQTFFMETPPATVIARSYRPRQTFNL